MSEGRRKFFMWGSIIVLLVACVVAGFSELWALRITLSWLGFMVGSLAVK